MPAAPVIRVSGLRKTYGRTIAVDDVSFEVYAGEIFGLIGPNGAGNRVWPQGHNDHKDTLWFVVIFVAKTSRPSWLRPVTALHALRRVLGQRLRERAGGGWHGHSSAENLGRIQRLAVDRPVGVFVLVQCGSCERYAGEGTAAA
jgi:hypothetical protein